ncbi:MAG TPA: hypothetical protein VFM29_09335, partial [Vicinamibacteria bacterium]|nr:hypothetical protein [Vicinamibacteria bacterium]
MVVVALGAAVLVSRQAVGTEFLRFEAAEREERVARARPLILEALRGAADDADREARLTRLGESLDHRLVLLAADGRVRAASTPVLREARFTARGDRL